MSEEAPLKEASGETLNTGVSVVITITSAKTIHGILNDLDNLSIVVYSREARIIVENMSYF